MSQYGLRVFEMRMLRIIFCPEREKVTEDKESCIRSSFTFYTFHHAGCFCANTSRRMQ
jgi:hypothetical protein